MAAVTLLTEYLSYQPKSTEPAGAEMPVRRILSISGIAEDHVVLRRLLGGKACRVVVARTCRAAFRRLRRDPISIIVCEGTLPDGTWRDVLDYLGSNIGKPILIVTSRLADEALWAEVLNLGGFDVIAKPFDPREIRHVLGSADLHVQKPVHAKGAAA